MFHSKNMLCAASLCAMLLISACSTVKESLQVKNKVEEPTLRLTLVPSHPYKTGTNNLFMAKLSDSKSRALLRREDTNSLQFFAIDGEFEDLHIVTPKPQEPSGLYHFEFTPKAPAYRVWAAVRPVGNDMQFPYTDLGSRLKNSFGKTEQLEFNVKSHKYELVMDEQLELYQNNTLKIRDTQTGDALPIYGLIGFYDDFRHIFFADLGGMETVEELEFSPQYTGFIRFFANVNGPQGDTPLVFTAKIIKK